MVPQQMAHFFGLTIFAFHLPNTIPLLDFMGQKFEQGIEGIVEIFLLIFLVPKLGRFED